MIRPIRRASGAVVYSSRKLGIHSKFRISRAMKTMAENCTECEAGVSVRRLFTANTCISTHLTRSSIYASGYCFQFHFDCDILWQSNENMQLNRLEVCKTMNVNVVRWRYEFGGDVARNRWGCTPYGIVRKQWGGCQATNIKYVYLTSYHMLNLRGL